MKFVAVDDLTSYLNNPRILEELRDTPALTKFIIEFTRGLISATGMIGEYNHLIENGVPLLHNYNVQSNEKLLIALNDVIEEYSDPNIFTAIDYNKGFIRRNSFPNEGVWFIQQKLWGTYCYWHEDKNLKLNHNSTLAAGFGNNSGEYNRRHLKFNP